MDKLNPKIAPWVHFLRAHGFNTCDSGDGETHDYACDRDYAYVSIRVAPTLLSTTADRLLAILQGRGYTVEAVGLATKGEAEIEASYDPVNQIGIIDLRWPHGLPETPPAKEARR